jgi:hypothetical protein
MCEDENENQANRIIQKEVLETAIISAICTDENPMTNRMWLN